MKMVIKSLCRPGRGLPAPLGAHVWPATGRRELPRPLIPADAGIQTLPNCMDFASGKAWVPASAGTSGRRSSRPVSLSGGFGLTAAARWRHVDAHCAEDLRPERDAEAGQDDDDGAKEGLETRTAGRIVVARTLDIRHYVGVSQI